MKKIAILTQPLIANYGGILQNYALQIILKKKGYHPTTVNRVANSQPKWRKLLSSIKNNTYNRFKGVNRRIFSTSEMDFITQNTKKFINKNISVSENIDSTHLLKKHFENTNYETVIVGSDQTWRPKMSADIYNYFLDFLEDNDSINKIAYASSFGTNEWEFNSVQTERSKELIQKFSKVSVRETSGIKLCNTFLNKEVIQVLDPTMLLHKEDYIDLFKNENLHNNKGIFTYILDKNSQKQNVIHEVESFYKLRCFTNQPQKEFFTDLSQNLGDYVYPKIESWLKSFHDADFVVTDSFHGTVFSIIFNKPFLVLLNEERGASRFHSLLSQLGLEERLITDYNEFSKDVLSKKIDFENVNKMVESLREISLDFLSNSIEKK